MEETDQWQSDGEVPGPTRPKGRLHWGPPWIVPATRRRQIDALYVVVGGLMALMGLLFFGWHGLLGEATATLAAVAAYLLAGLPLYVFRIKRLPDASLHVLGLGLMLGACLPVVREPVVPIAAGLVLGLAAHVVGRSHRVRLSPLAVALVAAWVAPGALAAHGYWPERLAGMQAESAVLRLDHIVIGDLYQSRVAPLKPPRAMSAPGDERDRLGVENAGAEHPAVWWDDDLPMGVDAMRRPQPAAVLLANMPSILKDGSRLPALMTGQRPLHEAGVAEEGREAADHLCRIEELIIGCVPGPAGATSAALIILLGTYLMYRRLSWWPMPMITVFAAVGAFMLLPVRMDNQWTLVFWRLTAMGPALAFILVGYVALASPLLLVSLVLAPGSAPMSLKGKVIYSIILGVSFIWIQWLLQLPEGGYVSLIVVGLLARPLDGLQRSAFVGKA